MRVLYIDTSSSYLYTGIVEDNQILEEIKYDFSHELSKYALPKIASMFENTNVKPSDINKIIVVNGPGSFTGIRIGLTIAKVYAWAFHIPITTITSLEAMACSVSSDMVKVPIIDARRNYSYVAIYDDENVIQQPAYLPNDKLSDILSKQRDYIFITNNDIPLDGKKCSYTPDIKNIVNTFINKEQMNPHTVNPNYLKLTEAEESRL